MSLNRCWCIVTAFIFSSGSFAAEPDPPMKWGEIAREDLSMTSFPADSNANVVILCDFGDLSFDSQYDPYFTRHVRIKIFKPSGLDQANIQIAYTKDDKIFSDLVSK